MPLWRCPHCGTPQPEAARCWVCRRSTTSCASCDHFRRGVAGGLGFCALDRRRLALRGDEIRACWTAAGGLTPDPLGDRDTALRPAPSAAGRGDGRVPRTFVPVDELAATASHPAAPGPVPGTPAAAPARRAGSPVPPATRWSLWGDADGG